MKLIDVDALMKETCLEFSGYVHTNPVKSCAECLAKPYAYCCVELKGDIIYNFPTIDAIPVEWLQRRRDIYLKAYHAGHESEIHTAAILNDTLMAWQKEQKEQEAQDVRTQTAYD